jgi:hypothetical protein
VAGGGIGGLDAARANISAFATRLSRIICKAEIADPMSSFFMLRREVLEGALRRLSGQGFKILLDLLASSPRPLRFRELPYKFRDRRLRGFALVQGLFAFYAICALGAVANVGIAGYVFSRNEVWWLAGFAGIVVGSVWNYAVSFRLHLEAKIIFANEPLFKPLLSPGMGECGLTMLAKSVV